jgi:2'-5' RNA ligase
MNQATQRFFIALLPPQRVGQLAEEIKQHFVEVYQSRAAQKSPAHITLQPPFNWLTADLPRLTQHLEDFTRSHLPIPMILDGFGAFKPRVIFIKVRTTPELLLLQENLTKSLESALGIVDPASKNRAFAPHLTVAYRDLTKPNFHQAWSEFANQPFAFEFTVPQLTLLRHDGQRWQIFQEFTFASQ